MQLCLGTHVEKQFLTKLDKSITTLSSIIKLSFAEERQKCLEQLEEVCCSLKDAIQKVKELGMYNSILYQLGQV